MNFPTSPALNDTYSLGSKTWKWNGVAWDLQSTGLTSAMVVTALGYTPVNPSALSSYLTTSAAASTYQTALGFTPLNKAGDTLTGALSVSGDVTLNGGTANGVTYLNGSKVLTSGSALTFDGTSLGMGNPTVYGTRSLNSYTGTTASAVGFSQQVSGFGNTWVGINNSGSTVLGMATGTFGQSTTNNIPWTVSAYGSEQMRLTSTGLGIGTTGLSSGKISTLVDLTTANGLVVRDSATTYANNDNFVLLQNSAGATAGGLTHPAASSLGVWGNDDIRFLQSSSATEQMRLTSTGLGIGTSSPATRLDIVKASTGDVATFTGTGGAKGYLNVGGTTVSIYDSSAGAGNGIIFGSAGTSAVRLQYGGTVGVTLDNAGNLGLGVTPGSTSASGTFQMKAGGDMSFLGNGNISSNTYYNGTNYIYATTAASTRYRMAAGQHEWYNAASGTAGNAISFTQAMTLDASGNFLVGLTSAGSVARTQLKANSNAEALALIARDADNYCELHFRNSANNTSLARLSTENGNNLSISTGGTERGRFNTGFSVGTTADAGAGGIYATGNITAYYSDARLKTVKGKIENALDKVATLSGVIYTNNDVAKSFGYESDEEQVGVLAQEIAAVMPQVVKPAPFDLDENGNSKSGLNYKTVQYERLVPLLIEAINELRAEVKALKGE